MDGICRSAASTAIITGFLAVVTRLLNQVHNAAVFIYGPTTLARLGRLVFVRHAVETVWRTTVGPVPGPIQPDVVPATSVLVPMTLLFAHVSFLLTRRRTRVRSDLFPGIRRRRGKWLRF